MGCVMTRGDAMSATDVKCCSLIRKHSSLYDVMGLVSAGALACLGLATWVMFRDFRIGAGRIADVAWS